MLDRVRRLSKILEERNISAFVAFSPQNIIYLTGASLDYTCVLATKDSDVHVISTLMEKDRALEAPYKTSVTLYSPLALKGPPDVEFVQGTMEKAISRVVEKHGIKGRVGYEGYYLPVSRLRALRRALPSDVSLVDASKAIWESRLIKVSSEVELIKKSCRVVSKVVEKVVSMIKPGLRENELASEAVYEAMKYGCEVDIYPIIASGERSALPHGRATDKLIEAGEAVVVDLTAKYAGYYSDMTRTVFVASAKSELKTIYEAVKEAQEAALGEVKDGVEAGRVDEVARKVLQKYGLSEYFTHSTGHSLGLDIHEPFRIASGSKEVIKEGMALTVEPGVYVKGLGGVRIEDTILVKKDGAEVLTEYTKELMCI